MKSSRIARRDRTSVRSRPHRMSKNGCWLLVVNTAPTRPIDRGGWVLARTITRILRRNGVPRLHD